MKDFTLPCTNKTLEISYLLYIQKHKSNELKVWSKIRWLFFGKSYAKRATLSKPFGFGGGGGRTMEDERLVLISKISTFSEPGVAMNFNGIIDNFFLKGFNKCLKTAKRAK